jgi:hypothetical protein
MGVGTRLPFFGPGDDRGETAPPRDQRSDNGVCRTKVGVIPTDRSARLSGLQLLG